MIRRLFHLPQRLQKRLRPSRPGPQKSYAQCGEDLILAFVAQSLGIAHPYYLDIGAHHPTYLSNTYGFYQKGVYGACIEPNPTLFEVIQRKRPRDLCLNVGVSDVSQEAARFYILSSDTLSTFSEEEAQRYSGYPNEKIEKIISIPIRGINEVLASLPVCPNLVSLDTEGMDLRILQGWNFQAYRPQMFCVETLTYTSDASESKIPAINEAMTQAGYFVYADTYINTIFVDQIAWRQR